MSTQQRNTKMVYAKEEKLGVLAKTPTGKTLRYTGESFAANPTMVESGELRGDRRASESRNLGEKPEGSFNYEFSADSFDEFLPAFLWTDGTPELSAGIVDGSTLHSFTFERSHSDIKSGEKVFKWSGSVPNALDISLKAEEQVTGSLSFIVKDENLASTSAFTTITPATTTKTMNATTDVTHIRIDGTDLDSFFAQSMTMNVNNGTTGKTCVGQAGYGKIDPGTLSITGEIAGYMENLDFYKKYKESGYASVSFELKDPDSNKKYLFELPKVQFEEDAIDASQKGESVSETLKYKALPGSDGHMIKIKKTTT